MGNARLAAYWDGLYLSGQHETLWETRAVSPDLHDLLSSLDLVAASQVLDLGCGSGLEACHMASLGLKVSGLDLSRSAIGMAMARAAAADLSVDFRSGNVLELPYDSARFDLLTDRGCLHLIPHGKWQQFAKECARVMKPGAHLYLRGSAEGSNSQFHCISQQLIEELFVPAGLEIILCRSGWLDNQAGGWPALQVLLRRQSRPQ
jgi:2-polyprenyl-3-methyl-5-hydroxy-6-metoxy-1,4-benzoquinol methylase